MNEMAFLFVMRENIVTPTGGLLVITIPHRG